MRLERIRDETIQGRHRVLTDVVWEEQERHPGTLTLETDGHHAGELSPSADAALVAMFPVAQWSGERRIRVEGGISPRLRDGLEAAMGLFHISYGLAPVAIEATRGYSPAGPPPRSRTASFLSGGVDALALLRANRLDYPSDHPGYVRDGLLLFGLNTYDHDGDLPNAERRAAFESHAARLSSFADRSGIELVTMSSNVRTFYPDFEAWTNVGFGAGLVSAALSLGARIDRVLLASAGLGMRLPMHGSHPSLDHHYSTEAVTVQHAQPAMTRLQKTSLVADWEDALGVLRSCLYAKLPSDGRINCGECDKCLRTMLGLLAVGRLERASTFPVHDVSPAAIDAMRVDNALSAMFLVECADALAVGGRADLARALRRKLTRFFRRERRRRVVGAIRSLID